MPDTPNGRIMLERMEERFDQFCSQQRQYNELVLSEIRGLKHTDIREVKDLLEQQNGRVRRLEACEAANLVRWSGHDKTHTTERGVFGALIAVGSAIAGWIGFNS